MYLRTRTYVCMYMYIRYVTESTHTCIHQYEVTMEIRRLLSKDLSGGQQLLYSSLDPHQNLSVRVVNRMGRSIEILIDSIILVESNRTFRSEYITPLVL